jgi:hypothetical protein
MPIRPSAAQFYKQLILLVVIPLFLIYILSLGVCYYNFVHELH